MRRALKRVCYAPFFTAARCYIIFMTDCGQSRAARQVKSSSRRPRVRPERQEGG